MPRSGDLGSDFLLHDFEPLFVHLLNGHPNLLSAHRPFTLFMPIIQMFKWDCELKEKGKLYAGQFSSLILLPSGTCG